MDTDPWSEDPPYSRLDGFHLSMVIPDLLHVVNMGVGRDLCGSILKRLVQENHIFHGTIEEKLAEATQSLRRFARAQGLPLRLKKFSKKKLNWSSNKYAEFKSPSGYDVSVVARWLQQILQPHTQTYPEFATLLWSLNNALTILYDGPWFLTEQDCNKVRTLGSVFMRTYLKLASESLARNEMMFRCKPKLHLLHHVFRMHRKVNPAKFSTWMDEDFLRHISKTLRLVNAVTAQKRILERWLLALPVHLQSNLESCAA
eukprot:Skav201189  [mRNA]  locus=scaffold633:23863:24636:+ [translate_table: standard]